MVRQAALDLPTALAFPESGAGPVHRKNAGGLTLMELQWSLAHGDTATVKAGLADVLQQAQQGSPGDIPIDFAYQLATLALAVGDSSAAIRLVAGPLDALPTLGTSLLDFVAQSGGLVRAMALRADLAGRTGDTRTAAHWASAVVTLWSDADAPLQPTVQRMRAIGGAARDR
jgi:hypothetical protein